MNNIITNVFNIFTTREVSIYIWLIIIAIVIFAKVPDIKNNLNELFKAAFQPKLSIIYGILTTYFVSLTYFLYKINFWDFSLLKDSILWFLFMGLSFCFKISSQKHYLLEIKSIWFDNIKATAFLETIINTYTFHFWQEFLIVPTMTYLGILHAVSTTKKEYKPAKDFLDRLFIILGIFICFYFVKSIYLHITNIATFNFWKSFCLQLIYTTLFIIPAIILKTYSEYEGCFCAFTNYKITNVKYKRYLQLKIILLCGLNFQKLQNIKDFICNSIFEKNYKIEDYKSVNKIIKIFQEKEYKQPYDKNCTGFNPRKASFFLKNYGLKADNYKYLDNYDGYDKYYSSSLINFPSGESLLYSIEGNNKSINRLYLELSESGCITEKPQNYNCFLNCAKDLYEKALKTKMPSEVYSTLLHKESQEYDIENNQIIIKVNTYPNRKNLVYYEFIIQVKKQGAIYENSNT